MVSLIKVSWDDFLPLLKVLGAKALHRTQQEKGKNLDCGWLAGVTPDSE
jgi:hypothetical protein